MSHINDKADLLCRTNDEYKYKVYSIVYCIVFVVGLCCNVVALYVFYKCARKKRVTTIYLINLALADLLFILTLPFRIAYYLGGAVWKFGDILCRVSTVAFYFSMYCSIYFLTCLSVSRYLTLTHPNKFTLKKALIICIAVWVFISISTSPFLSLGTQFRDNMTRCFEPSGLTSWTKISYVNYYALTLGFIIPFIMIVICYGLMIKHIIKTARATKHFRRDVAMIVLIPAIFCLSFLPYHIQRTVHLHYLLHHRTSCELHDALQKSVVATLCLAAANSCFDPLLYVFVGQGFKRLLKPLLNRSVEISETVSSSSKHGMSVINTTFDANMEMTPL